MTLAEIANKTGLSKRRLCYVLEHDFFGVSGADTSPWSKQTGHGNTRCFTAYEAFGLCVVATMLDAGLRRREIRNCMARLHAMSSGPENLLRQASTSTGCAVLQVGDRHCYRFVSEGRLRAQQQDTRWRMLESGDLRDRRYEPLVSIVINVARIRDTLRG